MCFFLSLKLNLILFFHFFFPFYVIMILYSKLNLIYKSLTLNLTKQT